MLKKRIFRLIPYIQSLVTFENLPSHENWNQALPPTVFWGMKNSKNAAKYDFNKFQDLIRFGRNLAEHIDDIVKEFPDLIPYTGKTVESVIRFLVKCFPWLMIFVQMIVTEYEHRI